MRLSRRVSVLIVAQHVRERGCVWQHGAVKRAKGWTDLVEPFAGGADNVAADGAGTADMPVGLLARPRADRGFVGVLTVRVGPWLGVGAGMGKGAGVLQNRRDQGKEGGPRGRDAHRAEQSDTERHAAVAWPLTGLQSDGGMDQLADKGGGNRQGERALHLDKIGTDQDLEGAITACAAFGMQHLVDRLTKDDPDLSVDRRRPRRKRSGP